MAVSDAQAQADEAMWVEYVEKESQVLAPERAKSAEQRRSLHRQRTLETLEATAKGNETEIEERRKKRSEDRRIQLEEEMKKMEEEGKKHEEERRTREAERKRRMEEEAERLEFQRNKEREERRKQRDEQMKKEMEEFNAREQERIKRRQERDSAREKERELLQMEEDKKREEEAILRAEAEKILQEQRAEKAQKTARKLKYLEAIDKQRKVILKDRVMSSVPLLENKRLDFEDIFEEVPSTGRVVPRYILIRDHFINEGTTSFFSYFPSFLLSCFSPHILHAFLSPRVVASFTLRTSFFLLPSFLRSPFLLAFVVVFFE
jgi:hypothetical protein